MARQITVLEQNLGETGTRQVRVVFWYPITGATKIVPRPGFSSALGPPGQMITAQEQADLEAGNIREDVIFIAFPTSYTAAQMKAEVLARYNDKAAAVAAEPATRAFFGVLYDSATGWSA